MKRLFFTIVSLVSVIGCNTRTSNTTIPPVVEEVGTDVSQVPGEVDTPPTETGPATEPTEGYTLIAPLRSPDTYLMNTDKKVVHQWKSDLPPTGTAYLMENGDLLRGARYPDFTHFKGGGIGYKIERYSWDGELLWTYQYANEEHCLHHDIAPMPNRTAP